MRPGLARMRAAWIEAGRRVGFVLLIVAGSAALGFLIAWPLWLFATSDRVAYTWVVIGLAAAGAVFLAVRAVIRRRGTGPRHAALSGFLTTLSVIVACVGLYSTLVLAVRRLWILALADLALWAGLWWLLGRARAAAKGRKEPRVPAENVSE